MRALDIGSDKSARSWCFWSTTESIQKDAPSVTAIIETLIAIPLYWWIALQVGMLSSLLLAVAVAPLVLLRSEESVALGISWLLTFEKKASINVTDELISAINRCFLWGIGIASIAVSSFVIFNFAIDSDHFINPSILLTEADVLIPFVILILFLATFIFHIALILFMPLVRLPIMVFGESGPKFSVFKEAFVVPSILVGVPGIFVGVLAVKIAICIAATLVHILPGIYALPRNFRRLTICTSPTQIPEAIPGIETTKSQFRFSQHYRGEIFKDSYVFGTLWFVNGSFLFFPAWIYRLTIKSTAWFWWPLAFLGGELRRTRNPKLLSLNVMGSLWAWTSIALACLSSLAFVVANLVLSGTVFQQNPMLTPLGYLLLIDWTPRLWQVCAVLGSALSLAIVFMLDHVVREYKIAQEDGDLELMRASERKFGWIERLSRLRFLLFIVFWLMVGTHAILYFNSHRCWFSVPPKLQEWAKSIYGDHLPPDHCLDRIPKVSS